MLLMINTLSYFVYTAKELELHYLLSGDADGAIILWELSLVDGKVHHVSFFFFTFFMSLDSFHLMVFCIFLFFAFIVEASVTSTTIPQERGYMY
jgi:hypothetical protein